MVSSVLEICELKRLWKNSHIFATDVRDAVRSAYLRISSQIWEGSLMWDFSKLVSRALCDFEIKSFIKIRRYSVSSKRQRGKRHGDAGKNCQVHRGRMPLKTRSLQRVRAPRSSTGADSVSKSIWSSGLIRSSISCRSCLDTVDALGWILWGLPGPQLRSQIMTHDRQHRQSHQVISGHDFLMCHLLLHRLRVNGW